MAVAEEQMEGLVADFAENRIHHDEKTDGCHELLAMVARGIIHILIEHVVPEMPIFTESLAR